MDAAYTELLEATIQHLERLKSQGTTYVSVSADVLSSLSKAAPAQSASVSRVVRGPSAAKAPSIPTQVAPPVAMSAPASPVLVESVPPGEVAPSIRSAPLDLPGRIAAMEDLRSRAMACQKCPHLARTRRNVVFGVGNIEAELMFVGEAPGMDEDEQGEPFVGRAGQLLTKIIQTMGFSRETVYIGNILKCRPDTPGQTVGNRKPTPEEMRTCLPFVISQIGIIQPKVIVALGGTAMEGLFNRQVFITKARGHWHDFRGIPIMPTYHPSYVLRNASIQTRREVWEDMLKVLEKLGRPITEKQRTFFQKAG